MPKGNNQKLKLYILNKIMLELTDDEHGLTLPMIEKELEKRGIPAERKSIYRDLEVLPELGTEIDFYQEGPRRYYYVSARLFELPELKLLVDAIQSSQFVTAKKSAELIKKLEGFVSIHQAGQLKRQVYMSERIKTMNESIYYSVDSIHTAIATNKKIKFHYFSWNSKKEQILRKEGAFYEVSPWALVWNNDSYYLVGYDGADNKIKHYRADKMKNISLLNESREGKESFEEQKEALSSKRFFQMFGGDEKPVRVEFDNELAGVVIDRFGRDVTIIANKDKFTAVLDVVVSPQFLGWLASFGNKAKILGPQSVVDEMKNLIEELRKGYE